MPGLRYRVDTMRWGLARWIRSSTRAPGEPVLGVRVRVITAHWGPGALDQETDQGAWSAHICMHAAAGERAEGLCSVRIVAQRSTMKHAEAVLRHLRVRYFAS